MQAAQKAASLSLYERDYVLKQEEGRAKRL